MGTVDRRPDSGTPRTQEENVKLLLQKFPQSATDFVLHFCRLSGEANENIFSSVKKTQSVAYCGNF